MDPKNKINLHEPSDPGEPVFCPLRSGAVAGSHPIKGQMILVTSGICLLEEEKECAFASEGTCLIKKFLEKTLSTEEEKT